MQAESVIFDYYGPPWYFHQNLASGALNNAIELNENLQ